MTFYKAANKPVAFISILAILLTFFSYCTTATDTTWEQLKSYINTIKVVNTHEHQRRFTQYEDHAYNFYTLLSHSYLQADLISAGAPLSLPEILG